MIKHSIKTGLGFGLTSGIITTLGLLIGLSASTASKNIVLAGIFTIAIADALSDSLGMHISQEVEGEHNNNQVWQSTFVTFLSKLVFASTFLVPVILFSINTAVVISIIWGLVLLSVFSYYIAVSQKTSPAKVIAEHISIAIVVIILSFFVGGRISQLIK